MLVGDPLPHSQHPTLTPAAHLSWVTANGDPKGASQTEISQFQLPIPVDEQVLRLQVPVQHVSAVTEAQAFQQLEEEWLHNFRI